MRFDTTLTRHPARRDGIGRGEKEKAPRITSLGAFTYLVPKGGLEPPCPKRTLGPECNGDLAGLQRVPGRNFPM